MTDNPYLDWPNPIVLFRGIPCEITGYHEYNGQEWADLRALKGEPFPGYTHGGWAYYPNISVSAKWAKAHVLR